MTSIEFVKKIKNYAVISFLIPLITINSCFLIYKFLGNINSKIDTFDNFRWNEVEHTYTLNEYNIITNNHEAKIFTHCPEYSYSLFVTTIDNQIILDNNLESTKLIKKLKTDNKIKSVTLKHDKVLNNRCVKNHQTLYSLLKKFSWLETILIYTEESNPIGFSKIRNPYFYGEVSISRTARYFPTIWIFKPFIILTAFLLFLYWKNNLNLFSELKNKNILGNFSKKFFYLGVFSCILLIFHATFLGLDFDSKFFAKTRRLIIILFIFFELTAQIFLTKNLFELREELKKYINPLILKTKIFFVATTFSVTCVAFTILAFGNPSTTFKHVLEWNYFSFLLFYYLLSRLLWK